jgi:peroxiredoxin
MRLTVATLAIVSTLAVVGKGHGQTEQARPWIGINIEAGTKGVRVTAVIDKTPAAKAGLAKGDEVLSIDGATVKRPEELISAVVDKGVGAQVKLAVLRGTKNLTISLKLEARPDEVQLLQDLLLDKPAPDFSLPDSAGPDKAKLADLKGNVVIVDFFATWCGPCRESIPTVIGWQKKYAGKGLKIVGISSEEFAEVAKFAKEQKIPYTVAADPKGEVFADAYHIPAIPALVVIDREGVVRHVDIGGGSKLDEAEAAFTPLLDKK